VRALLVVFYGNRGLSALLIKLFIPTDRFYNLHLLFGDGSYLALNHDIRTLIGTVFAVMILLVVALSQLALRDFRYHLKALVLHLGRGPALSLH
jgi:hypothetical protein